MFWIALLPLFASAARSAAVDAANFNTNVFSTRDTICPSNSNLVANCGPNQPSNWCCSKGSSCLSLNNTATNAVICCPSGSNCRSIQPINCDISLQDAIKNPSGGLHIANLSVALPLCGSKCCPLGYVCQDGGISVGLFCNMTNSTRAAPSSSASAGQTSTTSNPTKPSASNPATSAGSQISPAPSARSGSSKGGTVAAVLIPLLFVAIAAGCVLFFWRKRKTNHKRKISAPIPIGATSARTDFLGGPPMSISTTRPSTGDSRVGLIPPPLRPRILNPSAPSQQAYVQNRSSPPPNNNVNASLPPGTSNMGTPPRMNNLANTTYNILDSRSRPDKSAARMTNWPTSRTVMSPQRAEEATPPRNNSPPGRGYPPQARSAVPGVRMMSLADSPTPMTPSYGLPRDRYGANGR